MGTLEPILDRLARRFGAARWTVWWRDQGGWLLEARTPEGRDALLLRLAPRVAVGSGAVVLEEQDLGGLGSRLQAAGISRLLALTYAFGEEAAVALFENPEPARLAGALGRQGGLELADLVQLMLRVLQTSRWAGELLALRRWRSGQVADGLGIGRALRELGTLTSQSTVVALAPLAQGASAAAAWREESEWRISERFLTRTAWETLWADPGAAVGAAASVVGVDARNGWSVGRAGPTDPPVILGLAGGPGVSSEGLELFASRLGRSMIEDGAAATIRETTLLQERARIASVIHEGITQVMTNVAIQLEILDQFLEDPRQARQMVRGAREAVLEALDSLRGAVFEMTPPTTEWGDLATGLERYVADYAAQWGLELQFRVEGGAREVSNEAVALVFSVAQEALTNVRKHARTRAADVTLGFEPEWVSLSVQDWGVGFDPSEQQPEGFRQHQGLVLARARVRLLGGTLSIRAVPGGGVRLRVRIPSGPNAQPG